MLPHLTKNLVNFVNNRPPLIIFFLCLFCLSITCFLWAFHVNNNELLINTDKLNTWKDLADHLNNLSYCEVNEEIHGNYEAFNEINVETRVLGNFSNSTIHGYLNLEEWKEKCPIYGGQPKVLKLTINGNCAQISGPKELLPRFSSAKCKHEQIGKEKMSYLKSSNKPPESFCNDGKIVIVKFEKNLDLFADYLGETDRKIIYEHLIWSGSILMVVIIVIFIYALFYKKNVKNIDRDYDGL